MIQQAEFDFEAAWRQLNSVIGLTVTQPASLSGQWRSAKPMDAGQQEQQIITQSPLIAAAQTQVERARANVQRQRLQSISNVTAQVGAGVDDGTGDGFANVQLSLPLPIHNANEGNIKAAQAEYCQALQNLQRLELSLRQQTAIVLRDYRQAEAQVRRLDEEILPNAAETLDLMQQARAAGQFDFLRVLTARRTYFDAKLRSMTAKAELSQAQARLDGLLLTGGLSTVPALNVDDGLRGQALNGQ